MAKDIKAPKMVMIPEEKKVENTYAKEMKDKTHTIDPRPSFRVNEDVFPQIKGWVTGQKYSLEIMVEQTGSRIEDYGDDKGKLVAELKVCGIMEDNDSDEKTEGDGEYPSGMVKSKK